MKNNVFVIIASFITTLVIGQVPNISYPNNSYVFTTGGPINPLHITNIGGSVPVGAYGQVSTFVGTGEAGAVDGSSTVASFNSPYDVATDALGNFYVADNTNNKIRKISPAGLVTTLAGSGTQGSADGMGAAASFYAPAGIEVDAVGNVYVADTGNRKIRRITPAGEVSTFAGNGNFAIVDGPGSSASFIEPHSLAADLLGNVYVTDAGGDNIRKISPAGVVSTLAGSGIPGSADGIGSAATFNTPLGVAIDQLGNLYVAEASNHKIRKISPTGVVSTLAGSGIVGSTDGLGVAASFSYPVGITTDSSGNLFVTCEGTSNIIRKINSQGMVTTIAGNGTQGSIDGLSTSANFAGPNGIAVDAAGNVYIADLGNNKIRKITQGGYTISPNLPAGLSFDSTTGVISGTPTANTPATNYTVTACNASGCATTTLNITTSVLGTTIFKKDALVVYPNPTSSILNLQFPNEGQADKITITDLTGKVILTQTAHKNQVDVASLATGMYIIEVVSVAEKFTSKFIKD